MLLKPNRAADYYSGEHYSYRYNSYNKDKH